MESASQGSRKNSKLAKWVVIGISILFLLLILACVGTREAGYKLGGRSTLQASTISEISQLDQALSDYKVNTGVFPPCMGDATTESRQKRFFEHLTRAFPRYYVSDRNDDKKIDYLDLRQEILTNFKGKEGAWYDLDTMDQAETLVFWLGGFPTPRTGNTSTGQLMAEQKLIGFLVAPTAPFYDAPGTPLGVFKSAEGGTLNVVDHKASGFNFDELRLVDQDGDGWLEYVPVGATSKGLVPPYVYFDAESYTGQKTASADRTYRPYPSTSAGLPTLGPTANRSIASWGTAVPYAAALPADNTAPLKWINPRKFQIICAGMDNAYGVMGPTPKGYSENLPKIYPAGIRFDLRRAEEDNLTNFSDRKLGDVVE